MTSKFVLPVLITALGGIISMLAYDVMKVNGYNPLEPVATPVHETEPVATPVHETEPVATPVHETEPVATPVHETEPVANEEPFGSLKVDAERGDVEAQYYLGRLYIEEGVNLDYEKSVEWLTKAANQGHVDAKLYLTAIYLDDEFVGRDESIAKQWYMKACVPKYGQSCENDLEDDGWVIGWAFGAFED